MDKYGDGCLATEVLLNTPRFVTEDKLGNIFFSDSGNALVRRIDATTGIITLVAGGAASNPGAGMACGSGGGISNDVAGNGCMGSAVQLGKPYGLAFSPSGDLYFADFSSGNIRKIAATNGVIQTTGVISNVAGNVVKTLFGYNVNVYSGTTLVTPVLVASQTGPAASQSYLNDPSGITFDPQGNLYIADEGNNAIEVVNLGSSSATIMGLPVPAGTIAKLVGFGSLPGKTPASGECPDYVSSTVRGGCYFATFTNGKPARSSNIDGVYDVALDTAGNLYFANEFNDNVGMVTASTAVINNYAGIQGTIGKTLSRGLSTAVGIGSDFSVAVDQNSDLYVSDSSGGVIWRVDAVSQQMYVLAGGAATACSAATDAMGDGCPATQATLSAKGLGQFASTSTSPGVTGLHVDPSGSLLLTDASANRIRKISNGTQFGTINGSKPTQTIDVHFGVGDSPAANAYTLTAGATNFSLGSPSCIANSDKTTDCVLPVQATPTIPGVFTATLEVASTSGLTSSFALGGVFSPIAAPSTTTIAVNTTNGCSGTTVAVGSQITITSTSTGSGGTPTGTVAFFNGATQIGTTQTLNSSGQASVTTSLATAGTPSITAVYNGDPFFKPSTSAAAALTIATPTFSTSLNSQQSNTVAAGQAALYAITVAGNVYTGNINFACSGLPASSSCVFSPATLSETGCSNSQTVALTIATTQATPVKQGSFAVSPFGQGPWAAVGMLPGLFLALLITIRRRKNHSLKYGQIWLAVALFLVASGASACGNGIQSTPGTPSGTKTVVVTASDGSGNSVPLNVTLTVQ